MKRFSLFICAMVFSSFSFALEITSTVASVHPSYGQIRFTLDNHPCVGNVEFYTASVSPSNPSLDSEYKAGFTILLSALHSGKNVKIILNSLNTTNCNAGTASGLIWVGDIIGLSS